MQKDLARGWGTLLGALLLFLIPLGTRRVVAELGSAGDFSRLIIWALEVAVVALVAWWLWVCRRLSPTNFPVGWAAVFLLAALVSALMSVSRALALVAWVELALVVVMAAALAQIGVSSRRWLAVAAWALVLGGALQALVALGQFSLQHDLGLQVLGESRIAPDIAGVAKLDTASGKVVRAYGTFPHPNLLAAYLGVALLAWWWLFVRRLGPRLWQDALFLAAGVILLAGLAVTFSRLGAFGALAGFAFATWRVWFVPGLKRRFWSNARLTALFFVGSVVGLGLLLPAWFGRLAVRSDEQAVTLRLQYLKAAGQMITARPWFGVGPGVFTQALPRYSGELVELRRDDLAEPLVVSPSTSLGVNFVEPWQRQPAHNVPVLVLAELGVIGGAALAIFLWRLLKPLFVRAETTDAALVKTLAVGWLAMLFVFSLGDHFFWTVPQGRMLLWGVIALVVAATSLERVARAAGRWYAHGVDGSELASP